MEGIRDFVTTPLGTTALSTLTFFLGLWLGHRLELGRERRQDFNAAARPVRVSLRAEIERHTPYRRTVDADELDHFVQHLSRFERLRFERTLLRYEEAKQAGRTQDSLGQAHYAPHDDAQLKRLRWLLDATRQR